MEEDLSGAATLSSAGTEMGPVQSDRGLGVDSSSQAEKKVGRKLVSQDGQNFLTDFLRAARRTKSKS